MGATDCPACGGTGWVKIPGCPRRFVTFDVYQAIRWARQIADGGKWPLAGGALDHTECFLGALDRIELEESLYKANQEQ